MALHHFGNGNIRGAKKLYYGCAATWSIIGPSHGSRRGTFLGEMEDCFADVVASQEEFPQIEIVPDRIPEIHLDPPARGRP